MSNVLTLVQSNSGEIHPLRAGVDSIVLNGPFTNAFSVGFRTEDTGSYTLSSSTVKFEQLDGTLANTFTISGQRLLMAKFAYDTVKNALVLVPGSNLVGQSVAAIGGTGGTGGTGAVAQIAGGNAIELPYGSAPTVNTRLVNGVTLLDIGVPDGKPGTNATTGGTGGGSLATPEVTISPDASGNLTLDASLGYAFRALLTGNVKMLNPVGFSHGARVKFIGVQDGVGNHRLTWDTAWGFQNAQPPTIPTSANAVFKLITDFTADASNRDMWMTDIMPTGSIPAGYGIITPIAYIGTTPFYKMGGAEGQGAMNLVQPGQTIVVVRNGLSAEATGVIQSAANAAPGGTYSILGKAVPANGADQRPILALLQTDYGNGPPQGANRPAYGKALLNFEAYQSTTLRDLIITGARNDDADARGIGANGGSTLIIQNVKVTNCCNGLLSGNTDFFGDITIEDSVFDGNGIGYPRLSDGHDTSGSTHNIYCGYNNQHVTVRRSSFTNSVAGHEFKSRTLYTSLDRSYFGPSNVGRALDLPEGNTFIATDCIFEKQANAQQGNLMCIGGELGLHSDDLSRPRRYQFINCRFINNISTAGRDATFMVNKDPNVIVEYIDCEWIGDYAKSLQGDPNSDPFYSGMVTVNGERYFPGYAPSYTTTGGPIGPRYAVGYQTTAMTPIPA